MNTKTLAALGLLVATASACTEIEVPTRSVYVSNTPAITAPTYAVPTIYTPYAPTNAQSALSSPNVAIAGVIRSR